MLYSRSTLFRKAKNKGMGKDIPGKWKQLKSMVCHPDIITYIPGGKANCTVSMLNSWFW